MWGKSTQHCAVLLWPGFLCKKTRAEWCSPILSPDTPSRRQRPPTWKLNHSHWNRKCPRHGEFAGGELTRPSSDYFCVDTCLFENRRRGNQAGVYAGNEGSCGTLSCTFVCSVFMWKCPFCGVCYRKSGYLLSSQSRWAADSTYRERCFPKKGDTVRYLQPSDTPVLFSDKGCHATDKMVPLPLGVEERLGCAAPRLYCNDSGNTGHLSSNLKDTGHPSL